jgi:hypothetical protein
VDLTLESATATSQLTGDEVYTVRGVVQSLAKEASLLKALPSAKALCKSFLGPDNSALPSITVAQVASQIANFQSEVAKAQGTLPAAQLELCLTSLNDFKDAIFGSKSSRADPGLARLAELAPLNPFAAPFVASSVIRAAVTNSHIRMCSGVQALLQGFVKRIQEVREVIKALVSRSNDFRGLGGSDPTFQKGDKGNSHRILTPLLVGLLKAPRTRGLLVESVMDHVNQQTKKYWDTIRRSNGDACTDKLVIGSGPNATNFLSMLAELQGGALSGTLNVEASAKAGGTFGCPLQPDMIRALWRLNSRNRPQDFKDFDPAEFLPGGDKALNPFFNGVIQESDLGSDVYSTNESIWQATLLNMFLTAGSAQVSGIYVDVVMRNPRYAPGGGEPTYIVELVNSNEAPPNNRLSMKTNTPILFEGLAQERVADEQVNDRQSRLYLEAQRKLPLEQRQVLTGMELQARLGNRSTAWPLRGITKVIVIGDGDMGRIAAGQLLGIEPQVGLRNNTIDELPKIVWVGQERRTREEFLSRDPSDGKPERPRYAQLANFFPRKGDPNYAYNIEPYSEKFAGIASEVSPDGSVSYRVTLEKEPGAASAPSDDLTIDSSTLVVNCTGFKRDNLRTLRFLNGSRLTRRDAAFRSTALIKTPGTTVRYEPNQPQGVSSVEVFEVKKVTDEISDVTLRYEYNNGTIAYERLEVGPQATPTATGIFDSTFVRAVDVPGESPVNTEPLMVKRGDYSFSAGLQVTGEDIYLAGAADQSPPTQGLYDYLDSLKAGVGTRFRAIVEANGDNSVALFFKYLQQLELARHIATLDQGRNPPESLTDSPPLLPSRIQMPVLGRTTNDPLPKQSYPTQDTKATIKEGESPQDTLEYEVARATVFCDFPKTEAYSIELTISRPRNPSGGDALVFEAAAVMRADDSRIPLANCTEWREWLRSVSSRRAREAVLAMTNDGSQRGTFIKVTIPVDPDSSRKAQLGRLKTEVVRDDRERAALPTGTILEKSQFNAIKEFARNNNLSINDDFCRRLTIIDGRITEANFDGAGLVTLRGLAGIKTLETLNCSRNPQLTSLDGAPQSTKILNVLFCGLRDISAVSSLTSLEKLNLTGNRTLTSLVELPPSLKQLYAAALDLIGTVTIPAGTRICDLDFNPKLKKVIGFTDSTILTAQHCDLSGNFYEQLTNCSLRGNLELQSSPQHGDSCQSDTTYGVSILTTELSNLRDFAELNSISPQDLENRIILKDRRIVGLDLSEYTLTDLGLLKYFDNLKDLNLSRATGAIDLKNLPCYLETLDLSFTGISSLKLLEDTCPLLKTLKVDDTFITTLQGLPLGLQRLSARGTEISGDLRSLSKLALLEVIDISRTKVSSADGLNTTSLETFVAQLCTELQNSSVQTLKSVPRYDVTGCQKITDKAFRATACVLNISQLFLLFQDPSLANKVLLPDLRILAKNQYECLKRFVDANGLAFDKEFCKLLGIEDEEITIALFSRLGLVTLEGLEDITTLTGLDCNSNPRLTSLNGVPRNVASIRAAFCGLTDISAVGECRPLGLDISGNTTLTSLGELPPDIKYLDAQGCGLAGTVTVPDRIVKCDFSYNYGLKQINGAKRADRLIAKDCDLSGDSYEKWPAGSFSGNRGLQDSSTHGQSCAVDNLEGDTRPIFSSELENLRKLVNTNIFSEKELIPRIRIEDQRIVGLDLSGLSISSLDAVKEFPNLRALELNKATGPILITSLPARLESLDLSGTSIDSLKNLSISCPLLKTLIIDNTTIDTLQNLPPGLQKLSARETKIKGDLAGLSKLALLKAIDVSGTRLSSVEGLQTGYLETFIARSCQLDNSCVNTLQAVPLYDVKNCSLITDSSFKDKSTNLGIDQIKALFQDPLFATSVLLPDLRVLDKTQYECLKRFADANGINIDKDFCERLKIVDGQITEVYFNDAGLVTLRGLEDITTLVSLELSYNPQLESLNGAPQSTMDLYAAFCGLRDISAVSGLTSLEGLYLQGNRALTSLGKLPESLKDLYADYLDLTGTVTIPAGTKRCDLNFNPKLQEIICLNGTTSLTATNCDLSGDTYEQRSAGSFSGNRGLQDSSTHGQSCAVGNLEGDTRPIFSSELENLRKFADANNLSEGNLLPRIRIEDRRIVGLDLSDLAISDLDLRERFRNLKALKLTNLSCSIQTENLPLLLESLDVSGTKITSLRELTTFCPLLKTLIIDNTTIDTLQNLPPGLQKLSARGTTLTGDLAGLSELALLEAIDVSETNISSVKGLNTTSLQACIAESCPNLSDNGVETLKNAQLLYNADDSSPITNRTSSDGRSTLSSTALYLLFQDPSFQGSSLANEVLLPDLQVLQKTQYECLKRFVDANGLTLDREFCERLVIKGEEITGVKFSYLGLVTLEGLEGITTLTDLDCRGNPRLASLKGAPKSVLRIDGGYCGLTDIGAVSQLDELEQLNVDGCRNLRSLGKLPESIRDISAQACDLKGTVNIPSRTQSGDFSYNPNLRKISGFAEYCNLTARYCDLGGKSYSKLNSENSNFIGNQRLKISNGLEVSVGYNMTLPNDSRPIAATEFKSLEQFANTYEVELQELTQRVQIKDKKIVGLDLSGLSLNNSDLRNFPNVKALNLSNVTGEIDLSTLPTFLETLDVSQTQCDSLEYLYYDCPLLTTLNIDNTNVTSLNGLPLGLKKLSVRGTKLTGDLADLKKLDLLEAIRVSGNGISSVTGLNTTSLKIFIPEDCPQLDTDLNKEPLASAVEAGRKRLRDDEARDLLFTDPLFAT